MIDPVRDRQLSELNLVEVCTEILNRARTELYLNMRFLDVSLSSLGYEAAWTMDGLGTDGFLIYYQPDNLIQMYRKGRVLVNRAFLHMVFHCLFGHIDGGKKAGVPELWNLACDIAMESVIDELYQKCVYIHPSAARREMYLRLKAMGLKVLTAEGIYEALRKMDLPEHQVERLTAEFRVDSHELWRKEEPPAMASRRQNQWKDNREKLQTAMEMGVKDGARDNESLMEQVRAENRERYDYKAFLRKFAVLREELQIDADSFDYGFYMYGMSLYGNMPLLEPLETREIKRIEDFVIAVDTSMSCSGELVRRFLEETYGVLAESESYFRKINVHIVQCDDRIRSDTVITSREDLRQYMENFTVSGYGGTDFRPVFEYIRSLMAQGRFSRLKGLIYFTDGKGIYPAESPPYDTAFVFLDDNYSDISVPAWAIKLILRRGELEEKAAGGKD